MRRSSSSAPRAVRRSPGCCWAQWPNTASDTAPARSSWFAHDRLNWHGFTCDVMPKAGATRCGGDGQQSWLKTLSTKASTPLATPSLVGQNPQLVRAHEQVVVCPTHGVFLDEAVQEVAAAQPWIDWDRSLIQTY